MSSRTSGALKSRAARSPREWNRGRYCARLQSGGYIADIFPGDDESSSIHHWIVQRLGSPKVLCLGQECSFAAALDCGHHHLKELALKRRRKTGSIYEFKTPRSK